MIIGFGKTEIDEAKRIMRECFEATDGGMNVTQAALKPIERKYTAEAKEYKDADSPPERYSTVWTSVHQIYTTKYFVEFNFMHYNRRHAFSPDGWAALCTKWIMEIDFEGENSPEPTVRMFREV